ILAIVVTHLHAQDKMAASSASSSGAYAAQPPASAGLFNDWLRDQSGDFKTWGLGGQFRVRYEAKDDFGVTPATDFRATGVNNNNDYVLFRERFHVGYTPAPWITTFAEAQ